MMDMRPRISVALVLAVLLSLPISLQLTAKAEVEDKKAVMSLSSSSLTSSRSRAYFDAIDKARSLLESHKDLSRAVPSVVVVGMQSVGKSAVLSRISGVPFPQDSEVCTRVAIELRLRRGEKSTTIAAADKPMAIWEEPSPEEIRDALKKAQADVLGRREFESRTSIKINQIGPDLPEVTLVDLPGIFFAKNDASNHLEEQVKTMVNDRVKNEMALICHVVPLNQDVDTISTWKTVHDADKEQRRTVTIFTKADLAYKDGKNKVIKRLKNIQATISSQEDEQELVFIIHGAARNDEEEDGQLLNVKDLIEEQGLGHLVSFGISELNSHLEERMLLHYREKVPEMRSRLESELMHCNDELKGIGRSEIAPREIAMKDALAIMDSLDQHFEEQLPNIRELAEEMSENIAAIKMEPFGRVDRADVNLINKHFFRNKDIADLFVLAAEAKAIGDSNRQLQNKPFDGTLAQLRLWSEQFAKPCEKEAKQFVEHAFRNFRDGVLRVSLEMASSQATKKAVKLLIETTLVSKVLADKRNEALQNVAKQIMTLEGPDLFTTNGQYLDESSSALTQKLHVQIDSDEYKKIKSDMMPHLLTICDIHGFLEVQKRFVPDAVQRDVARLLRATLEDAKSTVIQGMLEKGALDLITEPPSIVSKRAHYVDRERQIEKALEEIKLL